MALREVGVMRILFAAFVSMIGKLLGKRGWFYKIAGMKAEGIDGPTPNTIPPYNNYVVLTPENPDKVAKEVADKLGVDCVIVDANDLSCKVLGASSPAIDHDLIVKVLVDNPLGQSRQSTPFGIIRKVGLAKAHDDVAVVLEP